MLRRVLLLVWVCGLPAMTHQRAIVWQSDLSVWTDATIGSESPRAWINRGAAEVRLAANAELSVDPDDQAIADHLARARTALAIGRSYAIERGRTQDVTVATANLAVVEQMDGHVWMAQQYARSALALQPSAVLLQRLCRSLACGE